MDQPTQLGPYVLLDRVSLGGMAEVFKAVEYGVEGFERVVAVKRILPHVAEDDEFITMFKDEAKIAVQLTHPNIAQIYSLGHEGDSFYIALEYVAGKDLKGLFERSKRLGQHLPIDMVCFITMKVCEGLDYAHIKKDKYGRSLAIIHRDVSPPNILVSYDGQVKLIDFGVAKAAGRVSKTQAGILKGKFGYMSPEQVRGMPLDRRSDVFSLGVVLWELLTSQRLFQGDTDFATLERVRDVVVPRPSGVNPAIPPDLEAILDRVLAANPDERYQSALELRDELQAFLFAHGMFYSDKDLAAWMNGQFAKEIELEKEKAPEKAEAAPAPRTTMIGQGAPPPPPRRTAPPPPGRPVGPPTAVHRAVPAALEGQASAPPAGRNRAKTMLMTNPKADIGGGRTTQPPTMAPPPPRAGVPGRTQPPAARAPAPPLAAAPAPAAAAKAGGDFEWDDEELETRLFDAAGEPTAAPAPAARSATPIATPAVPSALRAPSYTPPAQPAPPSAAPSMPAPPMGAPAPVSPARAPMAAPVIAAAPAAAPAAYGPPPSTYEAFDEPGPRTPVGLIIGLGALGVAALLVAAYFILGIGQTPAGSAATGGAATGGEVAAAGVGAVSLELTPADAEVSVDGTVVAGTGSPRTVTSLAVGNHTVRVAKGTDYLPVELQITVAAGTTPSVPVKLPLKNVTVEVTVDPATATLELLTGADATPMSNKHPLARAEGVDYKVRASAAGFVTGEMPIAFDGGPTQAVTIVLGKDASSTATGAGQTTGEVTPPPEGTTGGTTDAGTSAHTDHGSGHTKTGGGGGGTKKTSQPPKAKTAELKIGVAPGLPPAEVYVDGKKEGKTVLVVKVAPGSHTVKFKWDDGSSSQKVTVGDGQSVLVKGTK